MGTPQGDTVMRLNAGDPTIVTDSTREPGFRFRERVGTLLARRSLGNDAWLVASCPTNKKE
jgi:hypothetical protein